MPRVVADGVELYYESLVIGHTVPYLTETAREWLEDEVRAAREGRPAIQRQPRSDAREAEGPPTAFASSPLGRMVATTGTGLGRTPEDRARGIAVLREWDQRPRRAELARIDVPTLVIVGEREPRLTIGGARASGRRGSRARSSRACPARITPRRARPRRRETQRCRRSSSGMACEPAYAFLCMRPGRLVD